jgi:hypothetical protein
MIKGSIQKVYVTIWNIYIRNVRAPKYMHILIDLKGNIDNTAIILGSLNAPFQN